MRTLATSILVPALLALAGCAVHLTKPSGAAAPPTAAVPTAAAPSPFTATPPTAAPVAGVAGSAASSPARPLTPLVAVPAPPPGSPPPFATVIKDARRIDGPLVLWQKEEKVWVELKPEQFGQPFLFSPKIKSGISEAWVLGGLMAYPINGAGGSQVIEFQRVHNQVRLQARNMDVMAAAGTPEARAVADSYSHSLLGAVPVVSQPHPDRKSVLIEAHSLFLSDMLGIGMMLQRGMRQGYTLDRTNTLITAARGSEVATVLETQSHFYSGNIATSTPGAPPGMPVPSIPRFLPDARSLMVTLNLSIAPLPEKPMAPRRADPRVGNFTTMLFDFSDDMQFTPRQRYVNRWRLEKKDPDAELSDPVKPITFWIDRNVPHGYRDVVRSGILEWNKAFAKIGISNAIVVEQQPEDAKFDTLDFGYASVRWMMNADPLFAAIGPSHVDPRSGEILDADIGFEGMAARAVRGVRSQVLPGATPGSVASTNTAFPSPAAAFSAIAPVDPPAMLDGNGKQHDHSRCMHGVLAAEQLGYALDVLEARGDIEPDSPMAQQFVLDYIKEAIMHEVGHTLGLRHNFRASRAYTEAQLSDAEFTRAHGTTGSVMEYNAVNLPRPGTTGGVPFQTALGPYDFWAVEYAYKPLPAGLKPAEEKAELQKIAVRGKEPLLAFGTDEDIFFGLDPETIQLDLGSDPLAFAAKRLEIARDLFKRQEVRQLSPERDYAVLRRSLSYALSDVARSVGVLARQIGGVRTLRDFPGSGRDPLQPVAAKTQRESLHLISSAVLAADGLAISPGLQRRLAPDYLDRAESAGGPTDFALPQRLLELQRAVLNFLMSDGLAARVLDSGAKMDRPDQAFQLSELYQRLSDDLWGELGKPGTGAGTLVIAPARRELQRDFINRLATAAMRPLPSARVDSRGLLRVQARAVLARLEAAQARNPLALQPAAGGANGRGNGKPNVAAGDTSAHLADCIETLRQALNATLQRQGL
ncbi:MAG TPA: zinc-dependent metalloprotease [Rubrivivax sp.]|nr:zinc-dependent metalloprotease [Rubrivivax sp.]